jgi:hypothetical protein
MLWKQPESCVYLSIYERQKALTVFFLKRGILILTEFQNSHLTAEIWKGKLNSSGLKLSLWRTDSNGESL